MKKKEESYPRPKKGTNRRRLPTNFNKKDSKLPATGVREKSLKQAKKKGGVE